VGRSGKMLGVVGMMGPASAMPVIIMYYDIVANKCPP
jgi:hypothetical protein